MTKLQSKKLRFLEDKLNEALGEKQEIKKLDIHSTDDGKNVLVFNALMGYKGDENNGMKVYRWSIQMFISPRGAIHYYDAETDVRKSYKGGDIRDGAFFFI